MSSCTLSVALLDGLNSCKDLLFLGLAVLFSFRRKAKAQSAAYAAVECITQCPDSVTSK